MATYNKFYSFGEALAEQKHNLATDQLMLALTDIAPVSTNTVLADITEISYTNLSSRVITVSSSSQTSGVYRLILDDLVLTASDTVGPFRYIVVFNNSATNKELIGWYDYGAEVTLETDDTFTVDFDPSSGIIQLT